MARLHALRENLKAEAAELETVVHGKQQLEESMALLNKHKTNQFRTSMLMKWSRPGAGGADGEAAGVGAVVSGGYTPRTLAKKQAELKQAGADRKLLTSELKDCDEQLEQIEIEKSRLAEAADEDPDIADALEELREQLNESKKEKLAELHKLELLERRLGTELGLAIDADDGAGPSAAGGGGGGGGAGAGMDGATVKFLRAAAALWRKLDASTIEKVNVGQQEALGIKDLIKLSNEQVARNIRRSSAATATAAAHTLTPRAPSQIDAVVTELRRAAGSKTRAGSADGGDPHALVFELLVDMAATRKRLNDYTEGLLVQARARPPRITRRHGPVTPPAHPRRWLRRWTRSKRRTRRRRAGRRARGRYSRRDASETHRDASRRAPRAEPEAPVAAGPGVPGVPNRNSSL